jgi:hypothetical protein
MSVLLVVPRELRAQAARLAMQVSEVTFQLKAALVAPKLVHQTQGVPEARPQVGREALTLPKVALTRAIKEVAGVLLREALRRAVAVALLKLALTRAARVARIQPRASMAITAMA